MMKIELEFEGYYSKEKIPSFAGIYCVYLCMRNKGTNKGTIKELIYIGESTNANDRHTNHEKLKEWEEGLNEGEFLCYSFARITSPERERAEAALIFRHQPRENTKYTYDFPFPETEIALSGKIAKLHDLFTVPENADILDIEIDI